MSTRVDQLSENELQQRLQRLQSNLTELKNLQLAGSANLVTERLASSNAYDFQATITYQHTVGFELAISAADYSLSNGPFVWHVFWDVANSPSNTNFDVSSFEYVPSVDSWKYRLYIHSGDSTINQLLQIKVVIYGINLGSFSVVQIL